MENQNQDSARQQREALEADLLNLPGDDPRRAGLLDQIDRARQQEADAGRTSEANTIGAASEATPEAERKPDNIRRSESMNRGEIGLGAVRETVTVIDPAIIEAREASARTAAIAAQLEAEAVAQEQAATAQAEQQRRDQERDALIFEGGPSKGFTAEDYARMYAEATAEPQASAPTQEALTADEIEQAKAEAAAAHLTAEHGEPYRVMQQGEEIEGELIEAIEIDGQDYFTVQVEDEHTGQPHRVLVPNNHHQAAHQAHQVHEPGDRVHVARTQHGHQIEPAGMDYGM